MPYQSNRELPKTVKDAIPSGKGRTLFRNVVNAQLDAGKSESVSFASAWASLERAGYEKGEDGKWKVVQKSHVDKELEQAIKTSYEQDLCYNLHKIHGVIEKAEYQGKEVTLNKPFRTPGKTKKFAVYVKDGNKVKIVRFGDPDMEIRRDDKEARDNFRARHNCDAATDKTTAKYWSCRMWDQKPVSEIVGKRQLSDDQFTTDLEAKARSVDLGFGGEIHVHQTSDGQAAYMPGASHEEYLQRFEELADVDEGQKRVVEISIVVKSDGEILKRDDEQRIVYGWASVIEKDGEPVVDRQGHMIEEDELVKAVHEFVSESREGKVMHEGGQTSRIVDSIVFTKDLQEAMGINLGQVGWMVGVKVDNDDVWEMSKRGELPMFSIGGSGMLEDVDEQ